MSAHATRYSIVAIILHWAIALSIIGLIGIGLWMTRMEPGSPLQFQLYQGHKSVGITVLALSLIRFGWRLTHPPPALPAHMPGWERAVATGTHWVFYALMIGLPLTGWAMVSASPWGIPTVLYGLVPFPHIPWLEAVANKQAVEHDFKLAHRWLGWGAAVLIALHVGAALRHHVLVRDDVLRRMVPGLPHLPRISTADRSATKQETPS